MSDSLTSEIFAAANLYDLDLPAEVSEAQALLEAARTLHHDITTETAPDLTTVTAKTLTKAHAALIAHDNRDARLSAAATLVRAAEDRVATAMFTTSERLAEPLAALFDQAGRDFTAALAELDGITSAHYAATSGKGEAYNRLTQAADVLEYLRNVRAAFAPRGNRADTVSDVFEEVSRCLVITTHRDLSRFNRNARGVDYWREAIERGYTIKWQTRTEQETNSAEAVARQRAKVNA
ncbi:hypothetical protein [Humibacillus xanthopallidus]|uniref:Uncharacterized protein n=1 Tax=Humibacillus xanthopallidus TaxID=412689 RepID=A0A543HW37_9MICO|nr:hypothetical protein [Humibacillus xanthopallidus]TQM62591.1 hypothetical protein FBY41_2627 [Humibacillus xanthopallidus]